jgi:predicted 2-oxoglutarate/Fe(II)-dependent dioxygenase YbiX
VPGAGFFRALGLFVVDDFLDPDSCARISSEVTHYAAEKGRIGSGTQGEEGRLDETVRKVLGSSIPKPTRQSIGDRLTRLKPQLESHFQTPLADCDGPHFLLYGPGAFYKPHRDMASTAARAAPRRVVSAVLFLNDRSDAPRPNGYGGGSLTFHGLLTGEAWERCAFSLDASPGMIVAFRSSVLHEVEPVTFGERCTMVAWWYARPGSEASPC